MNKTIQQTMLGHSQPHALKHQKWLNGTSSFIQRLMLLVAFVVIGVGSTWADTETPGNTGSKDTELSGTSYSIAGTYIAGAGGKQVSPMESKGVKVRTNKNSNTLVLSVNSGYKITGLVIYGIANSTENTVTISSATVDGGSNQLAEGIELPLSSSSSAATLSLSSINATDNITLTFSGSATQALLDIHVTYEAISGYSITYHNNGHGTAPDNVTSASSLPDPLPTMTETDYTFNGWYTDEGLTTEAVAGTTLSANVDLYAKWTSAAKTPVTLSFTSPTTTLAVGASVTNAATADPAAATTSTSITYASSDETVATVDADGKVTGVKSGSATITASYAGNDTYAAATDVTYDITVNNGKPTITTVDLTAEVGETITPGTSFTAKNANGETLDGITYYISVTDHSSSDDVVTITNSSNTNGTLTFAQAGTYTCSAISYGKNNYYSVSDATSFTVTVTAAGVQPSDLAVSADAADVSINSTDAEIVTVTSSSDGAYTVTSSNTKIVTSAKVEGGKLLVTTGTATGTSTITIAQDATDSYEAGSKTVTVTVSKPTLDAPTISCDNNTVTITSAVDGATIYYTTDGSDPKTSSDKLTYSAPFAITANCTVKAYATASNYDDSEVASKDVTYTDNTVSTATTWDYTSAAPTSSPDNKLYYKYTANYSGDDYNNVKGIKLNSSGYAYFEKNTDGGTLTIYYSSAKVGTSTAISVYANTSQSATLASSATLIGKTASTKVPAVETIEIPEGDAYKYIYMKRDGSEGAIMKIVWTPNGTAQTVTANVNDATMGSVAITSGDYAVNSGKKLAKDMAVTFTATPNDSYKFAQWQDASTTDTYSATVAGADITATATFDYKEAEASDLAATTATIEKTYGDAAVTLAKGTDYSTSSDGAITYTSSDTKVVSVDNKGKLTFVGAGEATITLTQAATTSYKEGTATIAVKVNKADPTFSNELNVTVGKKQSTEIALASTSDGSFSITTDPEAATATASISGRTLKIDGIAVGTTTVTLTQAESANYNAKDVTFNITVETVNPVGLLEYRTRISAGGYFSNGVDVSSTSTGATADYSADLVSPLTKDKTSGVANSNTSSITITLNSTSAKKIVVGANPRSGNDVKIVATYNGEDICTYTVKGGSQQVNRYELSLSEDIPQGSQITLTSYKGDQKDGSSTTWKSANYYFYYFEVTSANDVCAPTITDNGDKTATFASQSDVTGYKYATKATIDAAITAGTYTDISAAVYASGTSSDGTATFDATTEIYAIALDGTSYSDYATGTITVETVPAITVEPAAVQIEVGKTQTLTGTATMNKTDVTSDYTFVYTPADSKVTMSGNTLTAVSAGSTTVTATLDGVDGASQTISVIVTDPDLISPEFTYGSTQIDINVGDKFTKTPIAYATSEKNNEEQFVNINSGYNISYSTSDASVATVDSKGVITGVKEGSATITATFNANSDYSSTYNGGVATIIVNVRKAGTEALTIDSNNEDQTFDLTVQKTAAERQYKTIVGTPKAGITNLSSTYFKPTFESSDWKVATVDATGLVTVRNVGTTTITVAYVPLLDYSSYNTGTETYTITVTDPARFQTPEGYDPKLLSTVSDNTKYVIMTYGGWKGLDGTEENASYGGGTVDYWANMDDGTKKDGGAKTDACGTNADYPYAVTAKSSGNPKSESLGNYNATKHTQFSVPCRGAYLMFEPSVDGTIEADMLQNGVLDNSDYTRANTGRLVYIIDEFGNVVTPKAYGTACIVKNPKVGASSSKGKLTDDIYNAALTGLGLTTDYRTGAHGEGAAEEVIAYNQGYAVLAKAPTYYTFDVKAGKKYYLFGNGTKNGFYGWRFEKAESFKAEDVAHLTFDATGNEVIVNDGESDMTVSTAQTKYAGKPVVVDAFDRGIFKSGIWNTLVLPYSMNDIQVKSIFGDGVDILYIDDVDGNTIKMSHHFYKTIVAGRPCLIKPSQEVTDLATASVTKTADDANTIAYPYVTMTDEAAGSWTDGYSSKADGYTLTASYDNQTVSQGDYFIHNSTGNFRQFGAGTGTLKGFRAFLKASAGQAKTLTVSMSDFESEESATTDIIAIELDENGNIDVVRASDKIYTIDGQVANGNSLAKGVYIRNGKKFVVK